MNLLEAYKDRLTISEQVYAKSHNGEAMPQFKKLAIARCLANTNKFLNEAFDNSVGTQRADMGAWKKFTLNLVNVALPDLIAFDLVIVQPMASITGYISYVKYTAGTNKGQTVRGHVFNDPFRLGEVDPQYTAAAVVENFTGDGTNKVFTVAWTPLVSVAKVTVGGAAVPEGEITVDTAACTVTLTNAPAAAAEVKIAYTYDNVYIPQNDLPLLNAEMAGITLEAKARRIAIYYSQIANYQAKTDYGFDLGEDLAKQAVGQLNYEIDTEVVNLLVENAESDQNLVWSKTLPVGVSKMEHYEGFLEVVATGKQIIYDRTKRYAPNYMLVASNIMPVISMIKAFQPAPAKTVNGPYFAGTLDGLKVYVSPAIPAGQFVFGVNGNDLRTSAAVYAPYMPVVPTMLLGQADGGMSQGFSTMYDLKILNKELLVAGRITA
jgi:hypothetical protein